MAIKYTVRIASRKTYEFWEATADTFAEMVEAEAELRDHSNGGGVDPQPGDQAQEQAIGALQRQGLVRSLPGLNGGGRPAPDFAPAGAQEAVQPLWRGTQQGSASDEKYLGEIDGYKVTAKKGDYGPYVNFYNPTTKDRQNANLPKGVSIERVTLDQAVQALNDKLAKQAG